MALSLESLAGEHREMFDDGAEGERGEELQAAEDEDDADEQKTEEGDDDEADGAEVGQTLDVYRNVRHPGPVSSKGNVAPFHRKRVGQVTIDHIYDDHFAHVTIAEGKPAKNDIVELRKD